jgi:hypothetical protein
MFTTNHRPALCAGFFLPEPLHQGQSSPIKTHGPMHAATVLLMRSLSLSLIVSLCGSMIGPSLGI